MKISKTGSSIRQAAYARRIWGGEGVNKKQIALDVGYSPAVSNSCVSKIESRKGFNNAMAKLAAESNSLALSIMHEFKSRGVQDFSNKDLISSLNAISGAWDKFNKGLIESEKPEYVDNGKNRLRTIMIQKVENQQIINPEVKEVPKDLDF